MVRQSIFSHVLLARTDLNMSEIKFTSRGKHKVMTGNGGLEMKSKEFRILRFLRGCTADKRQLRSYGQNPLDSFDSMTDSQVRANSEF